MTRVANGKWIENQEANEFACMATRISPLPGFRPGFAVLSRGVECGYGIVDPTCDRSIDRFNISRSTPMDYVNSH